MRLHEGFQWMYLLTLPLSTAFPEFAKIFNCFIDPNLWQYCRFTYYIPFAEADMCSCLDFKKQFAVPWICIHESLPASLYVSSYDNELHHTVSRQFINLEFGNWYSLWKGSSLQGKKIHCHGKKFSLVPRIFGTGFSFYFSERRNFWLAMSHFGSSP